MLNITISKDGPTPEFRVLSENEDDRIVVFMVQDSEGEAVWVIGYPGMAVTQHDASDFSLVESRLATKEDVELVETLAQATLGGRRIPVEHDAYGAVPLGMGQALAEGGSAPPLEPGREYEVVVVGTDGKVGSAKFFA